jgi:pyridoxal phosphate enzyme (YggS family)
MTDTNAHLAAVYERIRNACQRAGRDPASVGLIAVSKRQPTDAIRDAYSAGHRAFGENYLQEGLDKQQALTDLAISWHFVGPLQSNKTKAAAEHFDWVHTVDRLKIAQRLAHHRDEAAADAPLNCCIQVNLSGEASKSGVSADTVPELAHAVAALPGLRLRGLMTLPEPADDETAQRAPFARLRELLEGLRGDGLELDTLSMGMSDDLEAAVLEGATLVRVGTAVFGPRD